MSKKTIDLFIEDLMFKDARLRGFQDLRILTNWNEIVGLEMGEIFLPSKILKLTHNREFGHVLFLVCLKRKERYMFQFVKQGLKDKIDAFFGKNFIIDIRLDDPLDY